MYTSSSQPFPSSSLRLSALRAHHSSGGTTTWYPGHHNCLHKTGLAPTALRNARGSPASSSSVTTMFRAFSHIFVVKQSAFLFTLSCLFLLSLEIAGEPQDVEVGSTTHSHYYGKSPFSHSPSPRSHPHQRHPRVEYLHQSVSVMSSGRSERTSDHFGVDLVEADNDDITLFQQHLTTIAPLIIGNALFQGNKSRDLDREVPTANTASVIASSFINVDNAQTQSSSESDGQAKENGISKQENRSQSRKNSLKNCDTAVLKRCLIALPPMNDTGIPSTPQAVNTACRIYDAGINCFDSWSKNCLAESRRKKVKASIIGAHEMFSFLCKDPKFRADYLKHRDCYRKVSPHWDDCSRQFIEGLRRNSGHNKTSFCCLRLDFLTCVSKYSSFMCNLDATKFLIKMAETLVRSSIRTRSTIPEYCTHVRQHHCYSITDSAAQVMSSSGGLLALYVPATAFLAFTFTFLVRVRV